MECKHTNKLVQKKRIKPFTLLPFLLNQFRTIKNTVPYLLAFNMHILPLPQTIAGSYSVHIIREKHSKSRFYHIPGETESKVCNNEQGADQ